MLFCDTSLDPAREWNQIRNQKEQYEAEVLEALLVRFELPNGSNRWDSPLFSVQV